MFGAPMCSKDCLHKFILKLEVEYQRRQQAQDRLKRLIGFAGTVLALTLVTLLMQLMFPEYRKLSNYVAILGNGAYAVISTRMAIRDWRQKLPRKLIAMSLFAGSINFANAIWNLCVFVA